MLFAEVQVDWWVQYGCFGLVAYIAIWLTRWAPTALKDMLARHDTLVATFLVNLKDERQACEKRFDKIAETNEKSADKMGAVLRETMDARTSRLEVAIAEQTESLKELLGAIVREK